MAYHLKQLSSGAEVQKEAAKNALDHLEKFENDLATIYFQNVVPERLGKAKNLASKLSSDNANRSA